MKKILSNSFFKRTAPEVALDLIGKYLVTKKNGKEIASMILETEAYHGVDDLASHASRGITKRTEVMYGTPGVFYIYLIYGMYNMLNVVTDRKGFPSAVLIRATENASGPGKVTQIFGVTTDYNSKVVGKGANLWFENRGYTVSIKDIQKKLRIGIDYSGPFWSKKPWRFLYVTKNKLS